MRSERGGYCKEEYEGGRSKEWQLERVEGVMWKVVSEQWKEW